MKLRQAEHRNDFAVDHKVAFKLISEVLDNRITRQNLSKFDDKGVLKDLEPHSRLFIKLHRFIDSEIFFHE